MRRACSAPCRDRYGRRGIREAGMPPRTLTWGDDTTLERARGTFQRYEEGDGAGGQSR